MWLNLTDDRGATVLVNANNITTIRSTSQGGCALFFVSPDADTGQRIYVAESIEQLMGLLRPAG